MVTEIPWPWSLGWYTQHINDLPCVDRCVVFDDPSAVGVVAFVIWGDASAAREWIEYNRPAGLRVMVHQMPALTMRPHILAVKVVPPDRLRGAAVHWTVLDEAEDDPGPAGDA